MKISQSSLTLNGKLMNVGRLTIALCVGFVLWFATPQGLGLTPDSVAYIKAAQGLNQGLGFNYFSMQWPPGYSSLIYLLGVLTDGDFIWSARIINVTAYSSFFYLLAKVLQKYCRIGGAEATLLALLICLHPVVTHIFFYVLSEPLFLLIVLIDVTLLFYYMTLNKPLTFQAKFWLILVGCLAVSFRYAGLTVVALNMWFVIFYSGACVNNRSKWLAVISQALPAVLLISVWRLHRGIGDSEANERPLVLHIVAYADVRNGLEQIGSWFVSSRISFYDGLYVLASYYVGWIISVLFLISFLWCNAKLFTQYSKPTSLSVLTDKSKYFSISSTYVCGYIAFLMIIRSLFDPNIVFDDRTLSPAFLIALIALIVRCYRFDDYKRRYILLLILAIPMFIQTLHLKPWVLLSYYNGLELNDKRFKARPINIFLKSCEKNIIVGADKPWSFNLSFLTMVYWLPTYYQYGSGLLNIKYKQQISTLAETKDIIVVEAVGSEMVKNIDALGTFNRIYSADDGVVWQNNLVSQKLCRST
jgi:hypothetical protein